MGGAGRMPVEEGLSGHEARPGLGGAETGSMNFGEDAFVPVPADARRVVERAGELGIGLEAEMFDVGHVVAGIRMLESGGPPPPPPAQPLFCGSRRDPRPPPAPHALLPTPSPPGPPGRLPARF